MVYGIDQRVMVYGNEQMINSIGIMDGGCENFNTANTVQQQITTTSGSRKKCVNPSSATSSGISTSSDLTGLTREERRSK